MRDLGLYIALGLGLSVGTVAVCTMVVVLWTTEPWVVRNRRKRKDLDLTIENIRIGPVSVSRRPMVVDPPKALATLEEPTDGDA